MAKFIYRMQNVLDVKMKMEEQAKASYAVRRMKLSEEEEKLASYRSRKVAYEEAYRQSEEGMLNIREMNYYRNAVEHMNGMIKNQMLAVHVAQKNLEEAAKVLRNHMQERKTHEKLKEYAFDEFVRELNAQESKEIDELVSYTYGKSGNGDDRNQD